jgi:hypothetical protein
LIPPFPVGDGLFVGRRLLQVLVFYERNRIAWCCITGRIKNLKQA